MTDSQTNNPPATSPEQHRAEAPKTIGCAVITLSDTRTEENDKSGRLIIESLEAAGHEVAFYRIVKDEPDLIRQAIEEIRQLGSVQAILLTGGTGVAARDQTYETISALLEKRLDGFGEIFRMLSFEEVGAAAMLSRAVAGTYAGMVLFSMPGSTGAVRLALEKLIVPELNHTVSHATA